MGYIQDLRKFVGQMPIIMPSAGIIIRDSDGRILLQRRTDNGLWGIPGGAMEPGETAEETARREVREETGLEVGGLELFGIFSGPQFFYRYPNGDQVYNLMIIYLSQDFTGELLAGSDESSELSFFAPHELPAEITPPVVPVLEQYLRYLQKQ